MWVGIGGYSKRSSALEQLGTEADCTASGTARLSAWYELLPAPSRIIQRTVQPGDLMQAWVAVSGHQVTMKLIDVTEGWYFIGHLHASAVDTSSAEWIVEAPSVCQTGACRTLPLANFGSASFTSAGAVSTRGHTGTISDPGWRATRIRLVPGGRHFAAGRASASAAGRGVPGRLRSGGSAFTVSYRSL